MTEPIIVYSNGTTFIIDSDELYDPFPAKTEAEGDEELEASQNLRGL